MNCPVCNDEMYCTIDGRFYCQDCEEYFPLRFTTKNQEEDEPHGIQLRAKTQEIQGEEKDRTVNRRVRSRNREAERHEAVGQPEAGLSVHHMRDVRSHRPEAEPD
jgi:hypothetical protein